MTISMTCLRPALLAALLAGTGFAATAAPMPKSDLESYPLKRATQIANTWSCGALHCWWHPNYYGPPTGHSRSFSYYRGLRGRSAR